MAHRLESGERLQQLRVCADLVLQHRGGGVPSMETARAYCCLGLYDECLAVLEALPGPASREYSALHAAATRAVQGRSQLSTELFGALVRQARDDFFTDFDRYLSSKVKVTDLDGYGMVVVAEAPIRRGDVIVLEKAFLCGRDFQDLMQELVVMSTVCTERSGEFDRLAFQAPSHENTIQRCLDQLRTNCFRNRQLIQEVDCGRQQLINCSLLTAMFNHSCDNNVAFSSIGDLQLVVALRDIEAGEQLFDSYSDFGPRQIDLRAAYGFECGCRYCADGERRAEFISASNQTLRSVSRLQEACKVGEVLGLEECRQITAQIRKLMEFGDRGYLNMQFVVQELVLPLFRASSVMQKEQGKVRAVAEELVAFQAEAWRRLNVDWEETVRTGGGAIVPVDAGANANSVPDMIYAAAPVPIYMQYLGRARAEVDAAVEALRAYCRYCYGEHLGFELLFGHFAARVAVVK